MFPLICCVCFQWLGAVLNLYAMDGATGKKKDLSDGELSDDDDDAGKEYLDTSICKTCNLTFTNSKVSNFLFYYTLIHCHIALC